MKDIYKNSCVRVCVRTCVRACVRVCVQVCANMCKCASLCTQNSSDNSFLTDEYLFSVFCFPPDTFSAQMLLTKNSLFTIIMADKLNK